MTQQPHPTLIAKDEVVWNRYSVVTGTKMKQFKWGGVPSSKYNHLCSKMSMSYAPLRLDTIAKNTAKKNHDWLPGTLNNIQSWEPWRTDEPFDRELGNYLAGGSEYPTTLWREIRSVSTRQKKRELDSSKPNALICGDWALRNAMYWLLGRLFSPCGYTFVCHCTFRWACENS